MTKTTFDNNANEIAKELAKSSSKDGMNAVLNAHKDEIEKALKDNAPATIGKMVGKFAGLADDVAVHTALDAIGDWVEVWMKKRHHPLAHVVRPTFALMATQVPAFLEALEGKSADTIADKIGTMVSGTIESATKLGEKGLAKLTGKSTSANRRAHLNLPQGKKWALGFLRQYFLAAETSDFAGEDAGHWSTKSAVNHALYVDSGHANTLPEMSSDEFLHAMKLITQAKTDVNAASELSHKLDKFQPFFAVVDITAMNELPWWMKILNHGKDIADNAVPANNIKEFVENGVKKHSQEWLRVLLNTLNTLKRVVIGSLATAVISGIGSIILLASGMFTLWSVVAFNSAAIAWTTTMFTITLGVVVIPTVFWWAIPTKTHKTITELSGKQKVIKKTKSNGMWGLLLIGWVLVVFMAILTLIQIGGEWDDALTTPVRVAIWAQLVGGLLIWIISRYTLPIAGDILGVFHDVGQGLNPNYQGTITRTIVQMIPGNFFKIPLAEKPTEKEEPGYLVRVGTTMSIVYVAILMLNIALWAMTQPTNWPLLAMVSSLVIIFVLAEMWRKWGYMFGENKKLADAEMVMNLSKKLLVAIAIIATITVVLTTVIGTANLTRMGQVWRHAVASGVENAEQTFPDSESGNESDTQSPDKVSRETVEEILHRHGQK